LHPPRSLIETTDCLVGLGPIEVLVWLVVRDKASHALDLEDSAAPKPSHLSNQPTGHQTGPAWSGMDAELLEHCRAYLQSVHSSKAHRRAMTFNEHGQSPSAPRGWL